MMSSWLRYEYDGLNLLRIDERYDGDLPADGIDENDPWRPMNVFVHAPGQIGQIVECHSYDQGVLSERYWYMYDALGNVIATVDSYGNTTHWQQDAFGRAVPASTPWEPMSSFAPKEHLTGKMYDDMTGLYYFHARWYDPELGRFVSRDPVTSHDSGPHVFCDSNPTNLLDPSGEKVSDSFEYDSCCDPIFQREGISKKAILKELEAWISTWLVRWQPKYPRESACMFASKIKITCVDGTHTQTRLLCGDIPPWSSEATLYFDNHKHRTPEGVAHTSIHEKSHMCGWGWLLKQHPIKNPWRSVPCAYFPDEGSISCDNQMPAEDHPTYR